MKRKHNIRHGFALSNNVAYWHNAIVHWIIIATVFINIGVVLLFIVYVRPSDFPIRLQYNIFFGTSLHAMWWQVYFLPLVGFVFFIIDFIIGSILYGSKERIGAYIVLLGALFSSFALLIAALSVILNNYVL